MIELKELIRLYESDEDVRIVLNNGTIIIGEIVSVDDEEESGFSEPGVSLFTKEGSFLGLKIGDISHVSAENPANKATIGV